MLLRSRQLVVTLGKSFYHILFALSLLMIKIWLYSSAIMPRKLIQETVLMKQKLKTAKFFINETFSPVGPPDA